MLKKIRRWARRHWNRLDLTYQFTIAGIFLAIVIMLIAGALQTRWLSQQFLAANVHVASIHMGGIVGPAVQALEESDTLPPSSVRELDTQVSRTGLGSQILDLKVWRPDGELVYALNGLPAIHPTPDAAFAKAAGGEVATRIEFRRSDAAFGQARKIIEIYVPIRGSEGRVIAVGEFYQDFRDLYGAVVEIMVGSWLIRLTAVGIALAVLVLVVRGANTTIIRQRRALLSQHRRHLRLLRMNRSLIREDENAHRQAMQSGERMLSQIGSEIHDGPIQMLALATLHLGNAGSDGRTAQEPCVGLAATLVQQAMGDLRRVSGGLILPDVDAFDLEQTIRLVVARHERGSGTTVELSFGALPPETPLELRACLYRVVQEGLYNCLRHAQGNGQKVELFTDDEAIVTRVSDDGPLAPASALEDRPRLGLAGLRSRIEAFRGSLQLERTNGSGARLTARIPLASLSVSPRALV